MHGLKELNKKKKHKKLLPKLANKLINVIIHQSKTRIELKQPKQKWRRSKAGCILWFKTMPCNTFIKLAATNATLWQ